MNYDKIVDFASKGKLKNRNWVGDTLGLLSCPLTLLHPECSTCNIIYKKISTVFQGGLCNKTTGKK